MQLKNVLWIEKDPVLFDQCNNFIIQNREDYHYHFDYYHDLFDFNMDVTVFNLIVLEISELPDDLTQYFIYHAQVNHIPVIIITQQLTDELARVCLMSGAEDILDRKKVNPQALIRIFEFAFIRATYHSSNKDLKKLMVNNLDGIFVVDKNNKILFVNGAAEEIMEKKVYEIMQNEFPYSIDLENSVFFDLLVGEGYKKYVEMRSFEISWDNQLAYLVIIRDFSEFEEQKQQLSIFERFLNKSNQGFVITDLDYHYVFTNHAFLNMIGCSLEQSVRDLKSLFLEKKYFNKKYLSQLVEKKSMFGEFTLTHSNGNIIPVLLSAFLIYDDKQAVSNFAFILTNSQEQKEREEKIKKNQQQLFKILETIPVGIFILNDKGKPFFANNEAKHILGKDIDNTIKPDQLKEVYQAYLSGTDSFYPTEKMPIVQALNGFYSNVDDMEIRKNQEIIPIEVWGSPIYEDNELLFAVTVFKDISDRKAREKEKEELMTQLIRIEKLSTAGQLAAGVAHEFNNIMAVIKSSSELLLLLEKTGKESLSDRVIKEIHSIDRQTQKAASIVSSLMNIAKPREPSKELVSINSIIEEVLSIQNKQFRTENIIIEKKLNSNARGMLDKGQISQVLLNLIINARHAIKENGAGTIWITTFDSEGEIFISVKDNGSGMDDAVKDKIFTPFFTTKGASSKTGDNIPGTGLGLSVSHQIIQAHNGKINFKSEKDLGTEFVVRFPLVLTSQNVFDDNIEFKELLCDLTNKNIMIIDDQQEITDSLKELFGSFDCQSIKIFNDLTNFYEIMNDFRYDIVLLDMMMPLLNGQQIYHFIRQRNQSAFIIITTGNQDYFDQNFDLDQDKRLFLLLKPFSVNDLIEILNKL